MYEIEKFEHAGYCVTLYQDPDASSPADWDNLGELVAFPRLSRSYGFAERDSTAKEDDAMERGGFKLLKRYLRLTENAHAVPFRFFEHGPQVTLSDTDEDDERPDGFIVTTPARVRELCGDDPKFQDPQWIEDALRGELKVWAQYVEGDVYGYMIEGPEGEDRDSLWGLYGFEYAKQEAREAAEFEAKYEAEQVAKISRAMAL